MWTHNTTSGTQVSISTMDKTWIKNNYLTLIDSATAMRNQKKEERNALGIGWVLFAKYHRSTDTLDTMVPHFYFRNSPVSTLPSLSDQRRIFLLGVRYHFFVVFHIYATNLMLRTESTRYRPHFRCPIHLKDQRSSSINTSILGRRVTLKSN